MKKIKSVVLFCFLTVAKTQLFAGVSATQYFADLSYKEPLNFTVANFKMLDTPFEENDIRWYMFQDSVEGRASSVDLMLYQIECISPAIAVKKIKNEFALGKSTPIFRVPYLADKKQAYYFDFAIEDQPSSERIVVAGKNQSCFVIKLSSPNLLVNFNKVSGSKDQLGSGMAALLWKEIIKSFQFVI